MTTPTNQYTKTAKILHWLIGFAMIGMVAVGIIMEEMPASDLKWQLYGLHKACGVSLLFFIVFRFVWRLLHKPPQLDQSINPLIRFAAKNNILLLYVLMFTFPISDFLISYFGGHNIYMFGFYTIENTGEKIPEIAGNMRKRDHHHRIPLEILCRMH